MEIVVNNHWETTTTETDNGFKQSEIRDIQKFESFLTNMQSNYTATITATKEFEHVDVVMEAGGKKMLWELKSYNNFNPDRPIKYYWLKVDKAKYMLQTAKKMNIQTIYYCMFAGNTDYCYYIDLQKVIDGVKDKSIKTEYKWNRKTTEGKKDEWQWEQMILIPLEIMTKKQYK